MSLTLRELAQAALDRGESVGPYHHRAVIQAIDDAAPAPTVDAAALDAIEAKGAALFEKARRTAISNEDWRYSNGYNAAVNDYRAALRASAPGDEG